MVNREEYKNSYRPKICLNVNYCFDLESKNVKHNFCLFDVKEDKFGCHLSNKIYRRHAQALSDRVFVQRKILKLFFDVSESRYSPNSSYLPSIQIISFCIFISGKNIGLNFFIKLKNNIHRYPLTIYI